MLDLFYAEMGAGDDQADPESRDVIHPLAAVPHRRKRKEAGAIGPRLIGLPNSGSAYQKFRLIAVPNSVPLAFSM